MIGKLPGTTTHRGVAVTSLLDASERNLEPLVVRSLDVWAQASAASDTVVRADIFRAGSTLAEKKRMHLQDQLTAWGGRLAGVAASLLSPFGSGLEPLIADTLTRTARTLWSESADNKESRLVHQSLTLDDWAGRRSYTIEDGKLSAPCNAQPERRFSSAEEIKQNLVDTMRAYPSRLQVAHVFSHGSGHVENLAGVPPRAFGQALRDAAAETGRAPDVLLLESCLMGNLEALAGFTGGAQWAVASEKTLHFNASEADLGQNLLTGPSLAEAFSQHAQSGEQLARNLVDQVSRQKQAQNTVAAINLGALSQQVLPRLDELSTLLNTPEQKEAVERTLAETASADAQWGFLDFGSWMARLQAASDLSEAARAKAGELAQQLAHTVDARLSPSAQAQGLTGLSFQDPRVYRRSDLQTMLDRTDMPASWKQLQLDLCPHPG